MLSTVKVSTLSEVLVKSFTTFAESVVQTNAADAMSVTILFMMNGNANLVRIINLSKLSLQLNAWRDTFQECLQRDSLLRSSPVDQ